MGFQMAKYVLLSVMVCTYPTYSNAANDMIFVAEFDSANSAIWYGSLQTTSLDLDKIDIDGRALGVDYNPADNTVYWTELDEMIYSGSIKRMVLGSTTPETIIPSSTSPATIVFPTGIAIDPTNQHMYWVHNDINGVGSDYADRPFHVCIIERASMSDGSGRTIVVPASHGLKLTLALEFDPFDDYLYWGDLYNAKIERGQVDGTGAITMITTLVQSPNVNWPSGISIDFADQRLFYCDQGLDRVSSIDITPSSVANPITLFQADGDQSFFAMGVYGNILYWTDWEVTTLVSSNKYDALQREFVSIGPSKALITPAHIHIYQVDPEDSRCAPCCQAMDALLDIEPSQGSMLGGDILEITGMCSNLFVTGTTSVTCTFGTIDVMGAYDNTDNIATCVTPAMFVTGRIALTIVFMNVFMNVPNTYTFDGIFTMLSVEPGVDVNTPEVLQQQSWILPINRQVTWDPSSSKLNNRDVYIAIYGYKEDGALPVLTELFTSIVTPYSNGNYTFSSFLSPAPSTNTDYRAGIIKVYDDDPVDSSHPAAIWSDVHSLEWYYQRDSSWCVSSGTWISIDDNLGGQSFVTPACPCTMMQALVDFGSFSPHPECNLIDHPSDCMGIYDGAVHCVRANQPRDGAGQECCYNTAGIILNVQFGTPIQGFAHLNHHAGIPPYNTPGTVPYLSHFLNDLEPRLQCCIFYSTNCGIYRTRRPASDCTGYQAPTAGVGAGDPHLLTLDGTSYTFNGKGEYVMLRAEPGSANDFFLLQARTNTLPNSDFPVTVFVAVAAQYGFSDIVHVELNQRRLMDVWVKEELSFRRLNLGESNYWRLKGVSIFTGSISETGVLVIFDGGVAVQLKATDGENRVMSIIFIGPESFKDHTSGLLGTWNGNENDDFLTSSGTMIPIDSSIEEIHYQFGQTWQISAEESLFYYNPLFGRDTYRDDSFVPVFAAPNNDAVVPEEVSEACDGDEWCIFDYQATGDMEVAMASKESYEEQAAIVEASMNVVVCSALSAPRNGVLFVTRGNVGGIASYSCDEGYILMGMEQRVCQPNGLWFGDRPICAPIPVIGPSSFSLEKSVHIVLENADSLKVVVRRSGDTQLAGSVKITTLSNTASPLTDYVPYTEELQFERGVEKIERYIMIQDDDVREELESFEIRLEEPINSDLNMPDMATVFIDDDEVEHFFREIAYTVPENVGNVKLTVQRVGYLAPSSLNFVALADMATSSDDYSLQTSGLTFQQDELTAFINILIRNDDVYEEAEQFSVMLRSYLPGQIGSRDTAIVNIENDDDLCLVPCENGGICTDMDTCTCSSPAFYGRYCQLESCPQPCENGGTCTGLRTCKCAEGFTGSRCEFPVCSESCENGGTCSAPDTCTCTEGYTGNTCTVTVCYPPCLNGGFCNEFHACTCPFEFKGDRCMFPVVNDCLEPNRCGGTQFKCVETQDSFRCRCADGYYSAGEQCLLASRVVVGQITVMNVDEMPLMYSASLSYSGSREFVILEDILGRVLSDVFRLTVTGFLEVKIRSIREGSIIVEYEVLLDAHSVTGSQDVLNLILGNTSPAGNLASTLIRVDPDFTSIVLELCPPGFCGVNGMCQPEPVSSTSICICNDGYSGEKCSEKQSSVDDDDDEFSVAVIAGLGIVTFVMLVAIPVGVCTCYRQVRKFRYLKSQRTSRISLTNQRPQYQLPVYWFAGDSQVYLPPLYTSTDLTALSWENYL